MGETLITRRGGNNSGVEILKNAFQADGNTIVATGLDFNRNDYLCHIVSETSTSDVQTDIYIIKGGIVVEEHHFDWQEKAYATITVDIAKGELIAKGVYSNSRVFPKGSLLMILH